MFLFFQIVSQSHRAEKELIRSYYAFNYTLKFSLPFLISFFATKGKEIIEMKQI